MRRSRHMRLDNEKLYELSAIIESPEIAITSNDLRGIIKSWNKGAEKLYGYKASEIIGKSIFLLFPSGWKPVFHANIEKLKKGKHIHVETQRIKKDGKVIDVSASVLPIRDKNKKVIGTAVIAHDISELKRDKRQLMQTINELENIKFALDQSSIVAITDKNGIIEYVNDKFVEISKYKKGELIGNTHRVINSGYHPEEFFNNLWKTITSGTVWRGEIRNRARDGKYYWVDTTITPFLDENKVPRQFIAIRNDITQRVMLEEQKDDFISMASHELKTPVTSMKVFAQILKKRFAKTGDQQAVRFLGKMDNQLDKLTKLIADLLDISRVQSEKLALNKKTFSIKSLIKDTVEMLHLIAEKHAIQIEEVVDKNVYGDDDRIGQVLINLITNAVKYSPQGEKIIVSATQKNGEIKVSVKDFGIGISKENLSKIFDRFYQVGATSEKTYPGLGIGLYISSEIIKRHGGRIWAESKKEKGSTFCFTLPV